MKLWKKLTTLLLALALTAPCAFTACGEGNDGNNDGTNNEQGGGNTDDTPTYKQFTYDTTSAEAPGSEFNRYQGEEGDYEIQLAAGKTRYYAFALSQAGQYALITLEAKAGLTIERCDASEHFIAPTTYPATVQEDGTLYSLMNCSASYFNSNSKATYKISSTTDGIVKVRFQRVGEPMREPQRVETDVYAQEIVGIAPNAPEEYALVETPWLESESPSYFYDEDYEMAFTVLAGEKKGQLVTAKGFYRYGKESDVNAPVIWAAITTPPTRLFDATFVSIQLSGNNLAIQTGTDDNGDYLINNYVNFILNNGGEMYYPNPESTQPAFKVEPEDLETVCYMNVTNEDGMFPVNQELFEFLNNYMKAHPPFIDDGVHVAEENYWLAPCYYYEKQEPGSQKNPIELQAGDNTVTLKAKTSKFYKISLEAGKQYTFNASTGLVIYINDEIYGTEDNPLPVSITATVSELMIECTARSAGDYTLTITEVIQ